MTASACDGGREGEKDISSKDQRINEEIRASEVRLIDDIEGGDGSGNDVGPAKDDVPMQHPEVG